MEDRQEREGDRRAQPPGEAAILELGRHSFVAGEELQQRMPHVVTFLNKLLKDYGFIFGLSKNEAGLTLTVYRVSGPKL